MNIPIKKITSSIGILNFRYFRYIFSAASLVGSVFLVKKAADMFANDGKMSSESVRNLLKTEKTYSDIVVIDLRGAEKFKEDCIERAFNIDFSSPHFPEMVSKLDKGKTYLVYSDDTGINAKAAKSMHSLGFKNVYYPDAEYSELKSELEIEPQM